MSTPVGVGCWGWVRFRPPRSCSPWCEHRKAHDSSFKPAEPKRDSRCSNTSSAPNRHAFALTTYASVKLETEMSHEFSRPVPPGAAESARHRRFDQGVNAALRYCIAMLPCCRVIASLRCRVATSHCIAALLRCCVAASHIATQTQQRNDNRRWHRRHPRGTAMQRGNVTQCDVIPA